MKTGDLFTRPEISKKLGGSLQGCFLTKRKVVTGMCLVMEKNPEAPFKVLVGKGRLKEKAAQWLHDQGAPIPVFLKEGTNAWRLRGEFRAVALITDKAGIAPYIGKSRRTDVASVLVLTAHPTPHTS